MNESHDNKTLPHRALVEVMSEGRLELADEIVSPHFILHSPTRPEPFEGREGYRQFVTDLRRGFPDVKVTIEQVIAEDEFVAVRSRIAATHLGTYRGIPPTGRRVAQSQMHMLHVVDGQIDEAWQQIDGLGIMQQLGFFPRGDPPKRLLGVVVRLQKLVRRYR